LGGECRIDVVTPLIKSGQNFKICWAFKIFHSKLSLAHCRYVGKGTFFEAGAKNLWKLL